MSRSSGAVSSAARTRTRSRSCRFVELVGVRRRRPRARPRSWRPKFGARARYRSTTCSHDPEIDAVVNLTPPLAHARREPGRARRGQGDVQREAARRRARRRARARGSRAADGRSARSAARPTRSSASACRPCRARDRPGRHRRAARGERVHARLRARELAPEPVDLLPARRGAAPRHGSLLPHDARAAARPGARRQRRRRGVARAQRPILRSRCAGQMHRRRGADARRQR